MIAVHFFKAGDITDAEIACVQSWIDIYGPEAVKIWTPTDVEAHRSVLGIPPEWDTVQTQYENPSELFAIMSDIFRLCLGAAPKALDGADWRVYADTDMFLVEEDLESLFPENKDVVIGKAGEDFTTLTNAFMAYRPACPSMKELMRLMPGHAFSRRSYQFTQRFGSFFISEFFLSGTPHRDRLEVLGPEAAYGYTIQERKDGFLLEASEDGSRKMVHLWFRSWANMTYPQNNEEVVNAIVSSVATERERRVQVETEEYSTEE